MSRGGAAIVGKRDLLILDAEHTAFRGDLTSDLDLAANESLRKIAAALAEQGFVVKRGDRTRQ
jgi:hypothetical protein